MSYNAGNEDNRHLKYEDGKVRTGTRVDEGSCRRSRRVAIDRILETCIFREVLQRQ